MKQALMFSLLVLLLPCASWADGDFKFAGQVLVSGGTIQSVTPTRVVNSGCGGSDQKCSCTYDASRGVLSMAGQGTDGSATGLDFTCNWQVDTTNGSCLVQWRIDIPYSGDNGINLKVSDGCKVVSGFAPKVACSGHDFNTNTAILMDGAESGGSAGNIPAGSCT